MNMVSIFCSIVEDNFQHAWSYTNGIDMNMVMVVCSESIVVMKNDISFFQLRIVDICLASMVFC